MVSRPRTGLLSFLWDGNPKTTLTVRNSFQLSLVLFEESTTVPCFLNSWTFIALPDVCLSVLLVPCAVGYDQVRHQFRTLARHCHSHTHQLKTVFKVQVRELTGVFLLVSVPPRGSGLREEMTWNDTCNDT